LTEQDEFELYLLRRFFNYDETEAQHVIPAWYRDLLLRQLVKHETGEGASPNSGNAFDAVPEALRGL
jgi:hypothetical protein